MLFTMFIMFVIIGFPWKMSREKIAKNCRPWLAVVATGCARGSFEEKDLTLFPGPVVILLGKPPAGDATGLRPAGFVRTGLGYRPGWSAAHETR
jgi:hypothetical protein